MLGAGLLATAYGAGKIYPIFSDDRYSFQVKTWSDEDQITRIEPQVTRATYGKIDCDLYWDNGYSPSIRDP